MIRSTHIFLAFVTACLLAVSLAGAQCDSRWLPGPGVGGVEGSVDAIIGWDPDGGGPQEELVVVGGSFAIAGNMAAKNVAAWNGTSWMALGTTANAVSALAVHNGSLVAAGAFTDPNGDSYRLGRWNGTSWAAIPVHFFGTITSMTVYHDEIVIAGAFNPIGTVTVNNIARWNGAQWQSLSLGMNQPVYSLAVHDGELIAGGEFTTAGGTPANRIAAWNGTTWRPVGEGFGNGAAYALLAYEGRLLAAGSFTRSALTQTRRVAEWTGSVWQEVGGGFIGEARCLTLLDGLPVASGALALSGPTNYIQIMKFVGTQWTPLSPGIAGISGRALANVTGRLLAGGLFNSVDGHAAASIAAWNGTDWSSLGSGTSYAIRAVEVFDNELIAGGEFPHAGKHVAKGVARWNGVEWRPLGTGTNGEVAALATYRGELIAAGSFTIAGGVSANRIAAWNGTAWRPLGGGLNGYVRALAVYGDELWAGGEFANAGGGVAYRIARWNGTAWSSLNRDTSNGWVECLAVFNDELIIGGSFVWRSDGAIDANRIARWNRATGTLMPLGFGMNQPVFGLAALAGRLYAGGGFTLAGAAPANRVAVWDGSNWQALGDGTDATVLTVEALGSSVFFGGVFGHAGGQSAHAIAEWHNGSWRTSPGAFSSSWTEYPSVEDMIVFHGELICGGTFQFIDDRVSCYLARLSSDGVPWIASQPESASSGCGQTATFRATPATGYESLDFRWQVQDPPSVGDWRDLTDGPLLLAGQLAGSISGAATDAVLITPSVHVITASFRCVVGNACGSVTSNPATLEGCRSDFNCDGGVDGGDVEAFFVLWETGEAGADVNADGGVDGGDVEAFFLAWESGC